MDVVYRVGQRVSLVGILPEDAGDVLGELQSKKGLAGFEAKMFLQEKK